ncbi:MAG: FHA domain-containing protein, partial [Thermoanaerobaculia bacterium]
YEPESTAYWIEDLDSLNGTRLDGEPVRGRERLGALHVLSFGATAEVFFLELDSEPEESAEAEKAAGAPAEAPGSKTRVDAEVPTLPDGLQQPPAGDRTRVDEEAPTLPVGLQAEQVEEGAAAPPGSATRIEEALATLPASLAGDGEAAAAQGFVLEVGGRDGGRFALREGDNLIGRSGRAQIVLANRELSRRHATLRVAAGRVWLRDEGSRNHTFVGDEEISEETEIAAGGELRFGRLEARLLFVGPAGSEEEAE